MYVYRVFMISFQFFSSLKLPWLQKLLFKYKHVIPYSFHIEKKKKKRKRNISNQDGLFYFWDIFWAVGTISSNLVWNFFEQFSR